MAFIPIAVLVVWLGFSLLGFWKLSDPRRQVMFSGLLIVIALVITVGLFRSASTGAAVFGIGVIAALVRIRHAWHHLTAGCSR